MSEEARCAGACLTHCCKIHGCKYRDPNCPVANNKQEGIAGCEECGLEAEGYYGCSDKDAWDMILEIVAEIHSLPPESFAQRKKDLIAIVRKYI